MSTIGWKPGGKVTVPGAYGAIPLDDYHGDICAGPSVSHSGLNTILMRSPAHYWITSPYNPEREERAVTEAMVLGRAAHHLFLGETNFSRYYVVRPERLLAEKWNGNRTACKEWLASHTQKGLTILTPAQAEKIVGMSKSLQKEELVRAGLLSGRVEQSLFWQHETGIWLKARPDAVPLHDGDYADLKCVADITDDGVERSIGQFGYHRQGAMIGEACKAIYGHEIDTFAIVFVETSSPYAVNMVQVRESDLRDGVEENEAAIRAFAHCMKSGEWPGPAGVRSDTIRYAGPSEWMRKSAKYRADQLKSMVSTSTAAPANILPAG